MTPSERAAKIAELRTEADRLERIGNIKENAKNGDLFRSYGEIVLIPPSYPNAYAIALTGGSIGCQCYGWEKDPNVEYLGHARDLLTIKTPDAPEPTGAELVGEELVSIPLSKWNNVRGAIMWSDSSAYWSRVANDLREEFKTEHE